MSQASLGLLLDPGLGKTSTVLAIFSLLKELGYVDKMLVIAPIKPMYTTWPNEINKWLDFNHLTYHIIHEGGKKFWEYEEADIYLVNPEGLKALEPNLLALNCDVLAVDESTRFKKSTGKRFKILKRFLPKFARKMILTGTVCPNGLMDLFGQVYILDEGASLGRYITHFRKQWFYTEPWDEYNYHPLPNAFEEICDAVAPLCLQMNAEDHLDMPALIFEDRAVTLPPDVMKLYAEIENDYISHLPETNTELVALSDAAAGAKCRQICNGAVYVDDSKHWEVVHNAKLDALEELLDEIGHQPVIVCYEFNHDRERIENLLEDAECIMGLTGDALRDVEGRFNLGMIERLLVQPSGTHGLNLQGACHHMVFFGLLWDLEAIIQTIDRLYRQGQQSKMVMVYRLLAEGTLDNTVAQRLEQKEELQDRVERRIADYRRED